MRKQRALNWVTKEKEERGEDGQGSMGQGTETGETTGKGKAGYARPPSGTLKSRGHKEWKFRVQCAQLHP